MTYTTFTDRQRTKTISPLLSKLRTPNWRRRKIATATVALGGAAVFVHCIIPLAFGA